MITQNRVHRRCFNRYGFIREHSNHFVFPGNAQNPYQLLMNESWGTYTAGAVANVSPPWTIGTNVGADNLVVPASHMIVAGGKTNITGSLSMTRALTWNGLKPWRIHGTVLVGENTGNKIARFGENTVGCRLRFASPSVLNIELLQSAIVKSTAALPAYIFNTFIGLELTYDGNGNFSVWSNLTNAGYLAPSTKALVIGPIALGAIPTNPDSVACTLSDSTGTVAAQQGTAVGTISLYGSAT